MRTNKVLMIRPVSFGFNSETASSNTFQKDLSVSLEEIQDEFDQSVANLRQHGVDVLVVQDTNEPITPDAVFPNNWIQMRRDGVITLFPMLTENRRAERRQDIVDTLQQNFKVEKVEDLSELESEGRFLEGTGSLVFDHYEKVGYACESPRTNLAIAKEYVESLGYTFVPFMAQAGGKPIYHTNVVMAVTESYLIVCIASLDENGKRYFQETEKPVIDISLDQLNQFAGNMLELEAESGESLLVISRRAYNSLGDHQLNLLQASHEVCVLPLDKIEAVGGGSARCMIAENFLPKK